MSKSKSMGETVTGTTCSNRGIDNKKIFVDEADYEKFIDIMKHYLMDYSPEGKPGFKTEKKSLIEKKRRRNLAKEVSLLAFCLLPNQYEMLVVGSTTKFIRRVCTHYAMYFNKKYKRRGPLFEGRYQTKLIQFDQLAQEIRRIEQLPSTRVIRRFGPIEASMGSDASEYKYSSANNKTFISKFE